METLFTDTPLKFFIQNLWRDEAFTYFMAKESPIDILRLTAGDFNPPLYYLLMNIWIKLFGSSEIILRTPSIIFFGLTLYVVYLFSKNIFRFNEIKSILFTVFFALNPFLLYYASEARMYMMVTFFTTLSYYAFLNKNKRLYILSTTLGLYTHYFMVFVLAAQIIQVATYTLLRQLAPSFNFKNFKFQISNFLSTIGYTLYPLIFFLPWALYLISHHDFSQNDFWIIKPPLKDILYLPFILFTGYERVFGEYYHEVAGYTDFHLQMNILLIIVLVLPFFQFPFNFKNFKLHISNSLTTNSQLPTTLILWSFLPPLIIFIASYIFQPLFTPRYFIFSSAGFSLLLLYALNVTFDVLTRLGVNSNETATLSAAPHHSIKRQLNNATIKQWLGTGLFVIFVAVFLRYTFQFHDLNLQYHSKRTVSNMYQEIDSLIQPGDKVYLTNVLDYYLAKYYLNTDEIYIYDGKSWEETYGYVGKVLIPKDIFVEDLPIYPQKAFVVHWSWYEVESVN